VSRFDLGKYWDAFPEALRERYGADFNSGFAGIKHRYKAVGSGKRPLTVDDVMAIFEPDLPFVCDWTKPEVRDLAARMEAASAAKLIADLRDRNYDLDLLGKIIHCFRELTLTALVLQHVYPGRFAMCSHHLASQLYIAAPTVPKFYVKYCQELKTWSEHRWPTARKLTVLEAEYALWTWYRLAFHGKDASQRRRLQREFSKDYWIQQQRAQLIADSFKDLDKLDLARSYLEAEPTVAAIIAWRELTVTVHAILDALGRQTSVDDTIWDRIGMLPDDALPAGQTRRGLLDLWQKRNYVMKDGDEIAPDNAAKILAGVAKFIDHNTPVSQS
jgi:hypothetical protein